MTRQITSWYELLQIAISKHGEKIEDVVHTMSEEELHRTFDNGYGGTHGKPFTAWGPSWVYFPVGYDGAEWVGAAPRNPCDIKTEHQGGGI